MDSNSLSHTKWNCKYHIVFAPKFRRKIMLVMLKDVPMQENIVKTLLLTVQMFKWLLEKGQFRQIHQVFKVFLGVHQLTNGTFMLVIKTTERILVILRICRLQLMWECIKLPVNCDEYDELSNWLYEVENHIIDSFEFKGYIFDFSNYNKESIRVCKKYAYRAISGYLLSLAA